jgi:hypothetical protein
MMVSLIVLFSRVTMILGPEAVEIALGPFVWRLIEIRYADITEAGVVGARTLGYGGYGWPLRRAILVRSGDAVRLERKNRSPFVVTVDGATRAVETIRQRSRSG